MRRSRAARPVTSDSIRLSELFQLRIDSALRELNLGEHLVAYVSPRRQRTWVVRDSRKLLSDAARKFSIVDFASSPALAVFAATLPPVEGDHRIHVRAACKPYSTDICNPDCRKVDVHEWKSVNETDILAQPWKECVRDEELPKSSTCTDTYTKTCVHRYYTDDKCSKDKQAYQADWFEWLCS